MRDGVLTGVLLCASLGIPLGLTPRKTQLWSISILVASAIVSSLALGNVHIRPEWADAAFLNCWISIVACASCAYLSSPVGIFAALALSLNAGIWCGTVNVLAGSHFEVLQSLPAVAVLWPVEWAARRNATLAVKVMSSWLIAMAALSATLQFLPVTPGYQPDHLE